MAEDSDLEKTEPATSRRLAKARDEGQVARSRELGTFMALISGISLLWMGGGEMYRTLQGVLYHGLSFDPRIVRDTQFMLDNAANSALQGFLIVLPAFGLLLVVAVLSSIALGGLLLSGKSLEPKFERLNPLKGLKRFVQLNTLIELIKTLAKAGLIGFVAVKVLVAHIDEMLSLSQMALSAALVRGMELVALCCLLVASALLILVLLDVPWQIWNHAKQLRMSKEDVKQENKDSEGDPHIKGRIRQQQREMARRRMMTAVPAADVVVTNPTHYAVALRYQEGQGGAPVVVAKGAGLIAAQIRQLAQENQVALLEAPPLARALYRHVAVDQEIPSALYSAVAEVLAWVYQVRTWQPGSGTLPQAPNSLSVPPELDPQHRADAAHVFVS